MPSTGTELKKAEISKMGSSPWGRSWTGNKETQVQEREMNAMINTWTGTMALQSIVNLVLEVETEQKDLLESIILELS